MPRGPVPKKLINILEMDDPKLTITFHIMGPLTALTPHLESPLSTPAALHRQLAQEELAKAQELNATEGFLLKNMEKDCTYLFDSYNINPPRSGPAIYLVPIAVVLGQASSRV